MVPLKLVTDTSVYWIQSIQMQRKDRAAILCFKSTADATQLRCQIREVGFIPVLIYDNDN